MEIRLLRPELLMVAVAALGLADLATACRRRRADASPAGAASERGMPRAAALRIMSWTLLLALIWLARSATGRAALIAAGVAAVAATLLARTLIPAAPARFARMRWIARAAALFLALLLIARPLVSLEVFELRRPPLVVLLDDSRSMGLADADAPGAADSRRSAATLPSVDERPSRAEHVNAALFGAADVLDALRERYDLHVGRVGDAAILPSSQPARDADAWQIVPQADATALSAALRRAAVQQGEGFEHAACVLLISDGAENVEPPEALTQAAAELAERGVALIAVGVGPRGEAGPRLVLEPLSLPARIGVRDRLVASAAIRATGLDGETLGVAAGWDGRRANSGEQAIRGGDARLTQELDLPPVAPGLHRVTVRATAGDQVAEQHAVVEVLEGRIRVLMAEAAPREETAFLARVLAADPRFELSRVFAPAESGPVETTTAIGADAFEAIDVVILDRVPRSRLSAATLQRIADGVRERGMGLLISGGSSLGALRYAGTELEDLAPVEWSANRAARERSGGERRFALTDAGRRHAVFVTSSADGELTWVDLPDVRGSARFSAPKPLAEVLVVDEAGAALLAAHEAGRGRAAVVGWDACWHWALLSDAGRELHARFWRQMVLWLAHRRPTAWVLPDEPEYLLDAVRSGLRSVRIRAGVTAQAPFGASSAATQPTSGPAARLTLTTPAGEEQECMLHEAGGEWHAELTRILPDGRLLVAGEYHVTFETAGPDGEVLAAENAFRLSAQDVELMPPTSNLELLRGAAERTAAAGGRFAELGELETVLRELAAVERREKSVRRIDHDLVVSWRWPAFVLLVAALSCEWGLRRRAGMI